METQTLDAPKTLTVDGLYDFIEDRRTGEQLEIQRKVERMMDLNKKLNEKVDTLKSKLPSLIEALAKQGLGIQSMGYHKSGTTDEWKDGDGLNVSINAVPISGKFKYLTEKRYDRAHSKRRDEKGRKLETVLSEHVGIRIGVNQFSLECKPEDTNKRVLISIWIS